MRSSSWPGAALPFLTPLASTSSNRAALSLIFTTALQCSILLGLGFVESRSLESSRAGGGHEMTLLFPAPYAAIITPVMTAPADDDTDDQELIFIDDNGEQTGNEQQTRGPIREKRVKSIVSFKCAPNEVWSSSLARCMSSKPTGNSDDHLQFISAILQ